MVTNARCAVTVDAGAMERPYQGIVEICPDSLAASLENYFAQSVQVPSHLALISETAFCGGILLQQMPGEKPIAEDDWRRLGFLIATLRGMTWRTALRPSYCRSCLRRTMSAYFIRDRCAFSAAARSQRSKKSCGCSEKQRRGRHLPRSGRVDVTCEYCGRLRVFDPVDVSRVFADQVLRGQRIHSLILRFRAAGRISKRSIFPYLASAW